MGLFERIVSVSCQIPFLTRKLHFSEQELMGSLRMTKDGKHRDLNHPKSWIIYLWPIFTHPCWHIIAVFDIALIMSPWFPTQSTNTRGFLLIGHSAEIGLFPTTPTTVFSTLLEVYQYLQLHTKCNKLKSWNPKIRAPWSYTGCATMTLPHAVACQVSQVGRQGWGLFCTRDLPHKNGGESVYGELWSFTIISYHWTLFLGTSANQVRLLHCATI